MKRLIREKEVETMHNARLHVIVGFFLVVCALVTYTGLTRTFIDPDLKQAQIAYETEKVNLEREQLQRYNALEAERYRIQRDNLRRETDLHFYGTAGLFVAGGLGILIVAIGFHRAHVHQASVFFARIGQHSEIPVHQKDLQSFYPIAVNLSLAEIEASVSTAHENAYQISRQMMADISDYTRVLVGKRGRLALGTDHPNLNQFALPALTSTPTFAELLRSGAVAPGKPLLFGYNRQGQPQTRSLQDLKSVAVAGWQGSGKTLSMGYIVASSVLAYHVKAYIVDPHKQHPESLSTLIRPLELTGRVTLVNPFDTPSLLADLNRTLDRRLTGEEASDSGILLVIDELARLAKMSCFDELVQFLERCTEETRKANITFLGGSHKWTARHFKGRADIRGCMNSMLIHKTKPSQADLLLEDAHDKNLVKQIQRPGEAILVTDYDTPTLVTMPLCTRQDMETVTRMVGAVTTDSTDFTDSKDQHSTTPTLQHSASSNQYPISSDQHPGTNTISINQLRAEQLRKQAQTSCDPLQLTVKQIRVQLLHRKQQEPGLTQAEVARQAGMSPSLLSNILNGKRDLKDNEKLALYEVLFVNNRVVAVIGHNTSVLKPCTVFPEGCMPPPQVSGC